MDAIADLCIYTGQKCLKVRFLITVELLCWWLYMSLPAMKPTLWTLCKVSTRISLSMPCKLTRIYNFRLLWIFCFRNHYAIPISTWDGMYRPGWVCVDCAGWSWSIHYAEAIMLVFSRDGSYMNMRVKHFANVLFQTVSICFTPLSTSFKLWLENVLCPRALHHERTAEMFHAYHSSRQCWIPFTY